jgi:hypothetical protein
MPNPKTHNKPISTALLPYIGSTYNQLSRMLAKYNIKSTALPPKKISTFLWPIKDTPGLRTPGVYSILCECGHVYIDQRDWSTEVRLKT